MPSMLPMPSCPTCLPPRMRRWAASAPALACLLLAACVGPWTTPLQPGDTMATVQQRFGTPSTEHALADGVRRLEYTAGPYGKWVLMVDVDAGGRVLRAENVRDESHFNRVQPGITREQLRQQLGAPSWEWRVRYHDQTVWSYRFQSPFCLVFHVGITPAGVVEDTSYGPDPACEDPPSRRGRR